MRYSIEPRNKIFVKCFEFLHFAKNIFKDLNAKIQFLDSAKKPGTNSVATDAFKTTSKQVIQKAAGTTG